MATVLVLDDEAILAMELEMILTQAGYAVLGPALDNDEGLELLRDDRPDAAILDVCVRADTSHPVAEWLAQHGIPFLFVTGHGADAVRREYRDRPILRKPVSQKDLLARLAEMLGRVAPGARPPLTGA